MVRPTMVRWRVLALIMAASAVGYILRTNVSIAGPSIKSELGISETQLGVVLSAFVTTYALFQIPGGLLGERFGPRRVVTWILIGWGLVTLGIGLVPGRDRAPIWLVLGSLLFLRGAMGLLQAPFFPVTAGGTTRRWFPARRWALANSLQNVTFTLASAAAAPLLVWLIARFGWRAGLMSAAPLALTLAALWWWDTRDDPATHPRVNAAEVELIRAGAPTSATGSTATWLDVVRNRDVALLTLSYFSLNYVFYLFFNWFYYYLTEVRQIPPMMAGYFTGAQWIVGAAGAATGGVLCDWLSVRLGSAWGCRLTAMAGILVATPCLLLGVTAASPVVVVTLLSLSFASTQLVDPAYWVAAMRVAGPRAPLATGILNTGGNLSGSLAAILVPVIAGAWGWTAGVGSGVVFAVVAALLWLGVRADRPIAT